MTRNEKKNYQYLKLLRYVKIAEEFFFEPPRLLKRIRGKHNFNRGGLVLLIKDNPTKGWNACYDLIAVIAVLNRSTAITETLTVTESR